jgi:uncharacterized protein YkwD
MRDSFGRWERVRLALPFLGWAIFGSVVVACSGGAREGADSSDSSDEEAPSERTTGGESASGGIPRFGDSADGMGSGATGEATGPSSGGGDTSNGGSGGGAGTTSSGGSSAGGTTAGTTSGTTGGIAGLNCRTVYDGGAAGDPDGKIPVCCTPTTTQKAQIIEVFNLLNAYRAENGKAALTYDPKLEEALQGHCEHMRLHSFFSHSAPEPAVSAFTTRATLCGSSASSENLAAGQSSPAAVMQSWKNSSGHNANMLGNHKRVGICRAGIYWGQVFGN